MINQNQVHLLIEKINNYFGSSLKEKIIVVWGLSFKPNTDDIREAVSIKLVKLLSPNVKQLHVYDPKIREESITSLKKYKNIKFLKSKYENFNTSNALIICTEWDDFFDPEIKQLLQLKDKAIFDGRNILDSKKMEKNNISYFGMGS